MFDDGTITRIDELAHIIGQQKHGPRGDNDLPLSQRDEFDNLIVLCPTCHTMVDKDPQAYPAELLKKWKTEHVNSIKNIMVAPKFQSREKARNAVLPLLEENKMIFDTYGPYSEKATLAQWDTESMWRHMSLEKIIPNNRKIEALISNNRHLMTSEEIVVYNKFKLHREGFEYNKISGDVNKAVTTFPIELNNIFL